MNDPGANLKNNNDIGTQNSSKVSSMRPIKCRDAEVLWSSILKRFSLSELKMVSQNFWMYRSVIKGWMDLDDFLQIEHYNCYKNSNQYFFQGHRIWMVHLSSLNICIDQLYTYIVIELQIYNYPKHHLHVSKTSIELFEF